MHSLFTSIYPSDEVYVRKSITPPPTTVRYYLSCVVHSKDFGWCGKEEVVDPLDVRRYVMVQRIIDWPRTRLRVK